MEGLSPPSSEGPRDRPESKNNDSSIRLKRLCSAVAVDTVSAADEEEENEEGGHGMAMEIEKENGRFETCNPPFPLTAVIAGSAHAIH